MRYTGINHLALVTADMQRTIRFWRDLLGMPMVVSLGHPGYRHYFFQISEYDMIAFFEWPGVEPVPEKDHGVPVRGPVAFDHVSIGVAEKDDLWEVKARLEAAGFWVSEVIDHGFILSVYAFDPNNIPIEFSWPVPECDVRRHPVLTDTHPPAAATEGSTPRPEVWPHGEVAADRTVYPGEGEMIRRRILK
ncbi:MAG: VOC family protein [Desulfomicrobiaceae bacterium]